MGRVPRHVILILLLALVFLAPLFELFDESQDVEQGTDFVLVLLSVFVATGLFTLCKRMICFFLQLLLVAVKPADAPAAGPNPFIRVEVSPPECLMLLGSLRI